jgi:PAS domain S-box-containing protein
MRRRSHDVSPPTPKRSVFVPGEIALVPGALPATEGPVNHPDAGEGRIERAETRTVQAESRAEQAEMRTEQAKHRIEQAESRTEQAETRTEHAKTRTEHAEARTEHAEARTQQAEAKIERAKLDYQRLFESAKDGIIILDAETGHINDANPALAELLGFSQGELIDTPIWELGLFQDVIANKAKFDQLQAQGYTRNENLMLRGRDGRKITVEFVSSVYLARDRNVIQCNVRDITERKRAEEISVRLAAIVNSSDDAIIGKTLEGIITSWNPGAERMFGYSAQEAVGESMSMLFPPECKDDEDNILAQAARGEPIEHFEAVRMRKNGERIDVSVRLSRVVDKNHKVIGLSKIARDITQQKKAQKELHNLNAKLEQRVLDRTAQLEAANKELEAFSYSVSHDLRAPLRAIDGFSQALQEDFSAQLPEEAQRYLRTIRDGSHRMGVLIDDLLAFSRLSRLPLKREPFDMKDLVSALVAEMSPEIENRHARIEVNDLPTCNADPALMRQVWINLLSNAFKYTRKREGARIEIGAEVCNGKTTWFVRDNGTGFDMLYVDKLFGVFQRLHRAEEYEGTGVGLAIVHRIIERHGGRVWAEGALERGATFFFTLGEGPGE